MVVGQGAAGKTSTVRSLLGLAPEKNHISTEGVELTRTDAESWKKSKDFDSGFERQAYRVAALRMAVQKQAASKKRQSLPRRMSRGIVDVVRRRSSAARPFVAEEQVELVPEAEVARRFDIAEVEHMAGQTQSGEKIKFTIWDYAGQDVFYALHHIFLTREGGVFMLVFNMQELMDKRVQASDYLRFWLNSIQLHAPDAPVILVGSHYDKSANNARAVEKILRDDFQAQRGVKLVKNRAERLSFFPINNMASAADRATDLRSVVEKTASSLPSVSQKISLRWLKVLDDLMKLDCDHVPFSKVQEFATKYHAGDQTDELLKFFHELGMLVHLRSTDTLHDKVVMNPQWLLDKLSRVIADEIHVEDIYYDERLAELDLEEDFWHLRHRGIASRSLLEFLWDNEEVDYLAGFMGDTMLASDWAFPEDFIRAKARDGEALYLVSSLLGDAHDAELIADIESMAPGLTCVLDFSDLFLPNGVFARLLSLCAKYSSTCGAQSNPPRLSGRHALICFGLSEFALEVRGNQIWLRAVPGTYRPASTLKVLISMFKGARDAVFQRLPWKLHLQSPVDASILVSYDKYMAALDAKLAVVKAVGMGNARVSDFAAFFNDGLLDDDKHDTGPVESVPMLALPPGTRWHVFISHKQSEAGDACNLIAEKLLNRGLNVWIDQRTKGNLSTTEMRDGIRASKCYLLFLTKSVFKSDAVCMELETALEAEKPILLVHESNPDLPAFASFSTYISSAPDAAKFLFDKRESMPFQRRLYLAEGFYKELIARINAS
ncbi:Ras-related protein Rab-8A [Hondaea fermentalgiana]|uniref:non-specific serine/threonine protein kinase n=1 Tax=Hondaea fermentalgiana TaxID=2315210 RepID=A0A2R5GEJ4_9STRA|nr:Ras-related protein Rab-8A [Hondaea fermentalgiana]|eukprot:GBG28168.1 Ras-related protein Rab-8A [Hondaea fermentalgiana]